MKRYKAKVKASVVMTVWISEDNNSNQDIDDIEEVDEIDDFEIIHRIG